MPWPFNLIVDHIVDIIPAVIDYVQVNVQVIYNYYFPPAEDPTAVIEQETIRPLRERIQAIRRNMTPAQRQYLAQLIQDGRLRLLPPIGDDGAFVIAEDNPIQPDVVNVEQIIRNMPHTAEQLQPHILDIAPPPPPPAEMQ